MASLAGCQLLFLFFFPSGLVGADMRRAVPSERPFIGEHALDGVRDADAPSRYSSGERVPRE